MIRSVPRLISVAAVCVGVLLFLLTLSYIDLEETVDSAARLGLALPVILLPATCWQLLRTWGWAAQLYATRSRESWSGPALNR